MLQAEEIPIAYGPLSKEFLWRECVNRILVPKELEIPVSEAIRKKQERMRKDLTTSLWTEVK